MANREYDVFISYASENGDDARELRQIIESEGWKSFLAYEDLNKKLGKAQWSKKIDETLDRSGLVIVLVSPESMKSQWVEYEWRSTHTDILSGQPGLIIPCCLREIGPDDLGRALRRYQSIDFRDPARKQHEVGRLLDLIEGYLKKPIGKRKERNLRRILSLEGGGSRVLISCRVLARLEEKLNKLKGQQLRIADYFDMIVGTSAGGVLGCLLSLPDKSTAEIVKGLKSKLPDVFKKSHFLMRFLKNRYQSSGVKEALFQIFGNAKLSELTTACLIPTYELTQRRPMLLGQHRAKDGCHPDMPAVDAALASVSIPILFEPYKLTLPGQKTLHLVDGCLFARNPSNLAFEEARSFLSPRPLASEICLLSLGNGQLPDRKYDPKKWFIWNWIPEIIQIPMDATSDLVHEHFTKLYKSLGFQNQYLRIDADLSIDASRTFRFDDFRQETLDELDRLGNRLASRFDKKLEAFAHLLVKDG